MNNELYELYNESIRKTAEEMAKYIDEVMDYYLFGTGTGLLIVVATIILVLGVFVLSSQLGTIIKLKKTHIELIKETNELLKKTGSNQHTSEW